MPVIQIDVASRSDLPAIQQLLGDCHLPFEEIEALLSDSLVARSDAKLAGLVALEPCGQSGLLRSLAVDPQFRGEAIGRKLCAQLTSRARLLGIDRLYLLTTDAQGYFAGLGFETTPREQVPAEIQATSQFRVLCPQSAVCMTRSLRQEAIHATADLLQLRPDVAGARMWAVALEHTMLTYFEVNPHCRFAAHSHESEQITLVLSGELFFEIAGVLHCVKAGEVIAIPSAVPHAVWTENQPVTAVDAWSPLMTKYQTPQRC